MTNFYLPFTCKICRLKRAKEKYVGKITEDKLLGDDSMFSNTNTVFISDTGELYQKSNDEILYFRGKEYPYKLDLKEGQVIQHLDAYLIGGEKCTYEFRNCIPIMMNSEEDK